MIQRPPAPRRPKMTDTSQPSEVARETLRQLALRRIAPTPDNYRALYHEIAGSAAEDIFPERALEPLAKARILEDPDEVVRRAPDIILGSWCGKKFQPGKVAARTGWDAIPAVRDGQLFEVKSPLILQPGPAALTDGVQEIARIVRAWARDRD